MHPAPTEFCEGLEWTPYPTGLPWGPPSGPGVAAGEGTQGPVSTLAWEGPGAPDDPAHGAAHLAYSHPADRHHPPPFFCLANPGSKGSASCGAPTSLHGGEATSETQEPFARLPGPGPWSETPDRPFPAGLNPYTHPATALAAQDASSLFFPGSWKAHPVGFNNSPGPHGPAQSATLRQRRWGPPVDGGEGHQEEGSAGLEVPSPRAAAAQPEEGQALSRVLPAPLRPAWGGATSSPCCLKAGVSQGR